MYEGSQSVLRNRIAWYLAKWYFSKCHIILPDYCLMRWRVLQENLCAVHYSRTFRFVWKRHRTASCTCYFPKDGGLTGISLLILYKNRPFARSARMVQNQTCWDTSCTVGLPKQRRAKVDLYELLWFEVPLCNLRSMWPGRAKSLLASLLGFHPTSTKLLIKSKFGNKKKTKKYTLWRWLYFSLISHTKSF